jgi:hypothetical protein
MVATLRKSTCGRAGLHLVDNEWITIREGCQRFSKDLVAVKNKVHSGQMTLQQALYDKSVMSVAKRKWLKENKISQRLRI